MRYPLPFPFFNLSAPVETRSREGDPPSCHAVLRAEYPCHTSELARATRPHRAEDGATRAGAPFNLGSSVMPIGSSALGSSSSVGPALANLQIGNSVTPTQMTSGGAAIGNLPGRGTVDQQSVGGRVTAMYSLREQARCRMGRLMV